MHEEVIDTHLPEDILELLNCLLTTSIMLNYKIYPSIFYEDNYKKIKYIYLFKINDKFFFSINFHFNIISEKEYIFNKFQIKYSTKYFKSKYLVCCYNIDHIKKFINELMRYL